MLVLSASAPLYPSGLRERGKWWTMGNDLMANYIYATFAVLAAIAESRSSKP